MTNVASTATTGVNYPFLGKAESRNHNKHHNFSLKPSLKFLQSKEMSRDLMFPDLPSGTAILQQTRDTVPDLRSTTIAPGEADQTQTQSLDHERRNHRAASIDEGTKNQQEQ